MGKTKDELHVEAAGLFRRVLPPNPNALWPEGERVDLPAPPASVERTALEQAIAAAFAEPSAMSLHLTPRRPSLDQTIQEVWTEIAQDGVISDEALRTRLAQKLMTFACHGRDERRSLCSERSATIH
jgi:hypothetical protein